MIIKQFQKRGPEQPSGWLVPITGPSLRCSERTQPVLMVSGIAQTIRTSIRRKA